MSINLTLSELTTEFTESAEDAFSIKNYEPK